MTWCAAVGDANGVATQHTASLIVPADSSDVLAVLAEKCGIGESSALFCAYACTAHVVQWIFSSSCLYSMLRLDNDITTALKINNGYAAAPNRGELWCSVSKETQLRRKDVPTILKAAVGRVLKTNID